MPTNKYGDLNLDFSTNASAVVNDIKSLDSALSSLASNTERVQKNLKNLHKYTENQRSNMDNMSTAMDGNKRKYTYYWSDTRIKEKAEQSLLNSFVNISAQMEILANKFTRAAWIANQIKGVETRRDQIATLTNSQTYINQSAKLEAEKSILASRVTNEYLKQTEAIKEQANIQVKSDVVKGLARQEAIANSLNTKEGQQLEILKKQNQERRKAIANGEEENKHLGERVFRAGTILVLARSFARIISSSLKVSADWYENLNLFAVTFGETYEDTVNWAVEFSQQLGYSTVEIVKYTGLFKQLSDAIGVTAETGRSLSTLLTQLGADIASFYNITLESAMEKLQAGIYSGQTKPLRSVGIDVTYQSIDNLLQSNELLAQLGTSSKQLTQDQKVLARAILATNAAMNAWGDSATTINSLGNQVKVFQGSIENLKLAIGDMLSGVASQLIVWLNGLMMALTEIIRAFVPLTTTVGREVTNMAETVADEYADLEDEAGNLLSFDKFEVLNSDNQEDLNATEALTAELNKVIAEYMERQDEAMKNISNNAIKARDAILGIFGLRINEETGEIESVDGALNALWITVGLFVGLNLVKRFASIFTWLSKLTGGIKTLGSSIKALPLLGLISIITTLITQWDNLEDALKIGMISIGTLLATIVIVQFIKWINTIRKLDAEKSALKKFFVNLQTSFQKAQISALGLSLTIAGLTLAITGIVHAWDDMSAWERAISIIGTIIGALGGLALSLGIVQAVTGKIIAATAIAAGIAIVVGSITTANSRAQSTMKGYAAGGIPDRSELFYMNEYGNPEALVNTGGAQTNVINATQMGSLIKQGFIQAMSESGLIRAIESSKTDIRLDVNSEQLFKIVNNEGKRITGKTWRNI